MPSKRSLRATFGPIAALALASGCGPDHDRQMIYTMPRTAAIGPDSPKDKRAKAIAKAPAARPMAPSNGVDVPILGPD